MFKKDKLLLKNCEIAKWGLGTRENRLAKMCETSSNCRENVSYFLLTENLQKNQKHFKKYRNCSR